MTNNPEGAPPADPRTLRDANGMAAPPIQMLIVYNPANDQFGIQGAPQNKLLALGMLEMAKSLIMGSPQVRREQSRIARVAPGTVLPKTHQ